ncbi:MAG: response regulator, partial [Pseudomonadota bacterium]
MGKILVVDDESNIRELIKRILEKAGYECLTAASGSEARTHLQTRQVDLLLCDILMSGESGIELVRFLRS